MSLRYVESVAKKSCISIINVLSVSAYNIITPKPIVKKFCWKNKCHFLPNKKFRLVLSHISIFVRMRHNDANKTPIPHPLPYASFPEFSQNR